LNAPRNTLDTELTVPDVARVALIEVEPDEKEGADTDRNPPPLFQMPAEPVEDAT